MGIIPDNILVHFLVLAASFFVLSKCATLLVDGAIIIAYQLKIPKMVIGIVLVGFATTAPEFTVSVLSAIRGFPEIALGNAVGSVIVDDALALALGILVAPAAIRVEKNTLKIFGIFLIAIDILAFGLALNGILSRGEGLILLAILIGYLIFVFITENRKRKSRESISSTSANTAASSAISPAPDMASSSGASELESHVKPGGLGLQFLRFSAGVGGVILASEFLIDSAVFIAGFFGASPAVIGLTLVAVGTSLPEIMTCIVAFRRGHGDLALGDIIGADILNILWIIGAASLANPIKVEINVILFAFPWMLFIVGMMLFLARLGYKLQRWKGIVLLSLYTVYLVTTLVRFYSTGVVLF